MALSFDFGSNWQAFSRARLDPARLDAAAASLAGLLGEEAVTGRSFLDVGCGSGLFAIAAAANGAARVLGFDVNPVSVSTSVENARRLLPTGAVQPEFRTGSVLDAGFMEGLGRFDTVYAWGSLHHTGAMWQAIRNTAACVAPGGVLALAIYADHWSVPFWTRVKQLYNVSPRLVQRAMVGVFGSAIYAGVWVVGRQNPMRKERGMDFWYDVVDWLGGYPYEVATPAQLAAAIEPLGFRLAAACAPRMATGCHELVFRNTEATS